MSNEKETKVSALDAKAKALANEEDEDTKIAKLLKNMPKWRFYSLAVLTSMRSGERQENAYQAQNLAVGMI